MTPVDNRRQEEIREGGRRQEKTRKDRRQEKILIVLNFKSIRGSERE